MSEPNAEYVYGPEDVLCSIVTGPNTTATATEHLDKGVVIEFRDSSLFGPDEAVVIDVVRRPTGSYPAPLP